MPEDCIKIFDINLRQNFYDMEMLTASMRRCDVLKINDEEFELVARETGLQRGGVDDTAHAMMNAYGIGTLVLTCGENGSHMFADGVEHYEPTPKVTVADMVGAGDVYGCICGRHARRNGCD